MSARFGKNMQFDLRRQLLRQCGFRHAARETHSCICSHARVTISDDDPDGAVCQFVRQPIGGDFLNDRVLLGTVKFLQD